MNSAIERTETRSDKWGWATLLAMSALLLLHGATWFFEGPDVALSNIAERTTLTPPQFLQGSPSAFDIITLITRNSSVYEAALGLLGLIVAWQGYRYGSRWAWQATWVLVAAFAAQALDYVLAGGISGVGAAYVFVAAVALGGQLLAGRGLAS